MPDREKNRRDKFEEMLRAEYGRVYRFAFHLVSEQQDAVDLTQEAFRSAWENWSRFDGRSKPSTWLHQIVWRKYIDLCRKNAGRKRLLEELSHRQVDHYRSGHETAVHLGHDLRELVARLDEGERAVIVLRYFQEMTVAETAEVTGQPTGTVKWRTRNALTNLRRQLKGEEEQ